MEAIDAKMLYLKEQGAGAKGYKGCQEGGESQ